MMKAPELYKDLEYKPTPIKSGKLADLPIIGSLLYGAIVIFVNFKILQDSNSFTFTFVFVTMLSWISYFVVFYYLSQ